MKLRKDIIMSILLTTLFLFFSLGTVYYVYQKADNRKYKNFYKTTVDNVEYTIYGKNNFKTINNVLVYEDQFYTSRFGIDVSEFQDDIDWKKVKDSGVDFAILRIARRGATTNLLYEDDSFEDNYYGCKENNIDVGVYFFSQALTAQEAIEEVDYLLMILDQRSIELPIVLDYEESSLFGARTENVTTKQVSECADVFCKEVIKHGYKPMIYTNLLWYREKYQKDIINNYDIWFAQYDVENPTLKAPFSIWQYTKNGAIDGIDGDVDLDIMFIQKNDQSE